MDTLGLVMNYYWRPSFTRSVQISAALALHMAVESGVAAAIAVVDGSLDGDPYMASLCRQLDVLYIRGEGELSFAAGYNLGWRTLSNDYIALMASDIFVSASALESLLLLVSRPEVGCVSPYLSFSDWPSQTAQYVHAPITCEPTAMTLNLCMLKRSVLEAVGGIDEGFSGAYNDVILLMKIRNLGHKVLFAGDTFVTHLGRVTTKHGSTYDQPQDVKRFRETYPQYWIDDGRWHLKNWRKPFSTRWRTSALWWLGHIVPGQYPKRRVRRFAARFEPQLNRYSID